MSCEEMANLLFGKRRRRFQKEEDDPREHIGEGHQYGSKGRRVLLEGFEGGCCKEGKPGVMNETKILWHELPENEHEDGGDAHFGKCARPTPTKEIGREVLEQDIRNGIAEENGDEQIFRMGKEPRHLLLSRMRVRSKLLYARRGERKEGDFCRGTSTRCACEEEDCHEKDDDHGASSS